MGKLIDLTGQKFSRLTVLHRAEQKGVHGEKARWVCQCECGNIKTIVGTSLRNGATKSCGCLNKEKIAAVNKKDLTGKRYGRLLVLEEGPRNSRGEITWKCQCDCGAIKYPTTGHLNSGDTQSCGCLQRDRTSEASRFHLENMRFGKLLVTEYLGSDKNQHSLWKCLCDCGQETISLGYQLTQGKKQSCGCVKSRGEAKIVELLSVANISFTKEKTFKDCLGEKGLLRFDFYVDNTYLIEYDGEQHFHSKASGWSTEEQVAKTQKYDKIKNDYCREHNIPLIRIPYTKLETLCLDDLCLTTTQFLVK